MALQQRIERFEEATPTTAAYVDQPLPPLILSELEELHRREMALPQRSSAQARKLIVSAVVGGATCWGMIVGGINLALKLIA